MCGALTGGAKSPAASPLPAQPSRSSSSTTPSGAGMRNRFVIGIIGSLVSVHGAGFFPVAAQPHVSFSAQGPGCPWTGSVFLAPHFPPAAPLMIVLVIDHESRLPH